MSEINNAGNMLDLVIVLPNSKTVDVTLPSDMTPREVVLSFQNGEYGSEYAFEAPMQKISVAVKGSPMRTLIMDKTFAENNVLNNDSIQIAVTLSAG